MAFSGQQQQAQQRPADHVITRYEREVLALRPQGTNPVQQNSPTPEVMQTYREQVQGLVNPRAQNIPQTFPPAPITLPANASQEDCAVEQVRREIRESRSAFAATNIRFFRSPELHLYEFAVRDSFAGRNFFAHVSSMAILVRDARGEAQSVQCFLVAHPMLPVFLLVETGNPREGDLAQGRKTIERFPSNY